MARLKASGTDGAMYVVPSEQWTRAPRTSSVLGIARVSMEARWREAVLIEVEGRAAALLSGERNLRNRIQIQSRELKRNDNVSTQNVATRNS